MLIAQSCLTLCTPWTIVHQASLSIEFSSQEYWSGLLFRSPYTYTTSSFFHSSTEEHILDILNDMLDLLNNIPVNVEVYISFKIMACIFFQINTHK